jgi:hypothetical protein
MNPTTYQFLAEDHARALHREARAARPVLLARQASTAPLAGPNGRNDGAGRTNLSVGIVRRLVERLGAA